MKNFLFIFSFLFLSEISYCDIIPENSNKVDKCVKIINAEDFPAYCFLAYTIYPDGRHIETYKINSNLCIEKGYKFNSLNILAVKKDYLANKNLDTTNWLKDKNTLKSNIDIDSEGGYLNNDNPISSIDEYYEIVGFSDTSFMLQKCKESLIFMNQSALIRTYKYKAGVLQIDHIEYIGNSSKNKTNLSCWSSSLDLLSFIKALLYTIIIETIVLFLIAKTIFKNLKIKNGTLLLTGILTSFSTLPYVWFVLPIIIKSNMLYIIISELSAIIIESIIIWKLLIIDYKKAISVSFICNLTSFLFGLIISRI